MHPGCPQGLSSLVPALAQGRRDEAQSCPWGIGDMSVLRSTAAVVLIAMASVPAVGRQQTIKRIQAQDPALNNLVDPSDYKTGARSALGDVVRTGTGTQAMILIPGLGFSARVFDEFTAPLASEYRMYAVTLQGFGGTPAPPSPPEATSFGDQTWTNAALGAIEKLIADEHLDRPIIVGHWLTGTQIALRLALKHPGSVGAVVLLAGSARMTVSDPAQAARIATPQARVASIDRYMAPLWFKTVTRETWDDNNFLPGDYAVNPVIGLRLWREAAAPRLHVWVRYLCEFNAQDICSEVGGLSVPTLLLKPGLEGAYHDADNDYLRGFTDGSWQGCVGQNAKITVATIPNARVCLWCDQPEAVRKAVTGFLDGVR